MEIDEQKKEQSAQPNNGKISGEGCNLEAFRHRCRSAGLKITPQRLEIYKVLMASKEHPTAESVYQMVKKVLPDISFDTVNRTLNTLSDIGAAFVVEGSGQPKRFDGNLENHQHFRCIRCRRILDFHHEPFDNIQVPAFLGENFDVLRKTVYFEGICNICTL